MVVQVATLNDAAWLYPQEGLQVCTVDNKAYTERRVSCVAVKDVAVHAPDSRFLCE